MFQRLKKLKRSTAITATCVLLAAPVVAQTDAQSELALRGLEGQIAALQARGEPNPFELGALQTLRAVEKTLQTRYDYGLGDNALNMPLLRLPVTGRANPRAKPAGPEVLTTIFETFLADMDAVRVTLDQAKTAGAAPFTLKLDDIWFDVNLNARRDRGEGAIEALGPLLLGRRAMRDLAKQDSPGFEVRFDAADHAWLTAYTHMLSGFGNLYMAFDPTPVFTRLDEGREALKQAPRLPEYYDLADVTAEIATLQAEQTRLKAEIAAVREKRKPIDAEIRELRKTMNTPENRDKRDEINTQIKALRANLDPLRKESSNYVRAERLVRGELRSAKGKLPGGGDTSRQLESFRPTIDALYVLLASLKQQPDAAHIQAAMGHWREMIAQNRTFWMLIETETDFRGEWISLPQGLRSFGSQGSKWNAAKFDRSKWDAVGRAFTRYALDYNFNIVRARFSSIEQNRFTVLGWVVHADTKGVRG